MSKFRQPQQVQTNSQLVRASILEIVQYRRNSHYCVERLMKGRRLLKECSLTALLPMLYAFTKILPSSRTTCFRDLRHNRPYFLRSLDKKWACRQRRAHYQRRQWSTLPTLNVGRYLHVPRHANYAPYAAMRSASVHRSRCILPTRPNLPQRSSSSPSIQPEKSGSYVTHSIVNALFALLHIMHVEARRS